MTFIIVWIVCILCAAGIGDSRGKGVWGFMCGLLFGPLGILLAFALPDVKKKKEDEARQAQLDVQLKIQQAQLDALNQMRQAPQVPSLIIASNGVDLGEIPVQTVKAMVAAGKLSASDHYLDRESNQWVSLSSLSI